MLVADSIVDLEFGEPLAEACPEGSEWDAHKGAAQRLTEAIREALGWDYAGDVSRCSTTLVLQRHSDGNLSVRPFGTCKRRWCPVCAWRLSRRRWAYLVQRLPGLVQEHGPVKWLLLTLTIRNVPVESLKEGCRTLLDGFRRLSTPRSRVGKLWPATGWIRALEVTFPREGEAHPHLHVLAAVRPSYFKGGNYVSQAEWVRRWREAARLDYDPVVDVRRVKPLNLPENALPAELSEALGGLREVSKYIVKPADWTPTALAALTSVGRIRFIEGGGWLKGVFREDDADQLEDVPDDPVEVATFWWRAAEWRYRRKL